MPPFRNPFNRRPAALSGLGGPVTDENARPASNGAVVKPTSAEEQPGYGSSRGSSALSIPRASKEPDEFKMSGGWPCACAMATAWRAVGDGC